MAIANGGTGATTAAAARTNLGLAIGTDVQAFDAQLTDVAGLTPTADNFLTGDGTNLVMKTPAQARTSLGLGTAALLNSGTAAGDVTLNSSFPNCLATEKLHLRILWYYDLRAMDYSIIPLARAERRKSPLQRMSKA